MADAVGGVYDGCMMMGGGWRLAAGGLWMAADTGDVEDEAISETRFISSFYTGEAGDSI